jgi:hypothetical protein
LFTDVSFPHRQLFDLMSPVLPDFAAIPKLGRVSTQFVEACFALGKEPGDGPKLTIIEQPETARVILVEWLDVEPMTADQYNRDRSMILRLILRRRQAEFEANWASSKQIGVRTGFEWKGAKKADEEEEAADETDDTAAETEEQTSAAASGEADGTAG